MKKVYVCAPLGGNIEQNLKKVKTYTEYALRCGTAPVVPHFYALCLDDNTPKDREIGLAAGMSLLWLCDEVWVFGDTVTEGMRAELKFCKNLNIRVRKITEKEIQKAIGGNPLYTINPLEPKAWTDSVEDIDANTPEAFKKVTRLSQHIAFLKDFFRSYKDFTDSQIDTIEILLSKLYARFGITDTTDYSVKKPSDFPIMEDFYKLCEEEFMAYDKQRKYLYTEETLQEVCLGIHSMCVGSESKYFNGHTNITDSNFLVFGVKGLMDTNRRLKDCMLFNILSYMSNELLGKGGTAASVDELYLFLSNMTTIEYLRNCMKRVRKKDSSVILASQNIEDFLIPSIREFTKPLFSIPTHQFLFNAGQINPKEYMDALQVEPSEFELIKYPERGTCLYRCGNERYLLQVIAPEYKAVIFGKAGGR